MTSGYVMSVTVQNCQDNAIGSHCEKCEPGYYNISAPGLPARCLPCQCPLPTPDNPLVILLNSLRLQTVFCNNKIRPASVKQCNLGGWSSLVAYPLLSFYFCMWYCLIFGPPDIVSVGLRFYPGYFFFLSFCIACCFRSSLRNSPKLCHIFGSEPDLKMHIQNMACPSPKIESKTTYFWRFSMTS